MKIALFGGSFNPIHKAHVKLACRFFDKLSLDKVIFVPTYTTPLKDNSDIAESSHRLKMCELALRDYNNFQVSDIEIQREGISYTSDTVKYYKSLYIDSELYFILGADMFLTLDKWHEFEYLFKNLTFLTAPRDDCGYKELCDKLKEYEKYNCKAYITKEFIEDLSSSYLRDIIKKDLDVSDYLNKDVIAYIEKYDLYG